MQKRIISVQKPMVGNVIGGHQAILQAYPVLPSSLPNKVVVTGSRYDQLPGKLQQKITWAFGQDMLGELVDPVSFPFAQVNNRKITLSFRPATEADEQALKSLLLAASRRNHQASKGSSIKGKHQRGHIKGVTHQRGQTRLIF